MNSKLRIVFFLCAAAAVVVMVLHFLPGKAGKVSEPDAKPVVEEPVRFYTCGMHPSVHVTPEEYAKGSTACSICLMDLVAVMHENIFEDEPVEDVKSAIAPPVYYGCKGDKGGCPRCDQGQTDAKCVCAQHTFAVLENEGMTRCPVCDCELQPLPPETASRMRGIIGQLQIKGEQLALAGIASEPIERRILFKEIRAAGKVAFDPALMVAQQEYLSARKASLRMADSDIPEVRDRAANLVEASRKKLLLLGLSKGQIVDLAAIGQVQDSLLLPEETMWIYGEVYEYESRWVMSDAEIRVTAESLSGRTWRGRIDSVSPVVDKKTRTLRFRAQVENPDLALKPEMYVDIRIISKYVSPYLMPDVLALPKDALLDTGVRKVVWVDKGEGRFEGRKVTVGPLAVAEIDGVRVEYYPLLKGVADGERVVTRANFLLDSQSRISGAAAAAYGGALEGEGASVPAPGHQH